MSLRVTYLTLETPCGSKILTPQSTLHVLSNKPTNALRGYGTGPGEIRAWTLPGAVWLATGRYRPQIHGARQAQILTSTLLETFNSHYKTIVVFYT